MENVPKSEPGKSDAGLTFEIHTLNSPFTLLPCDLL